MPERLPRPVSADEYANVLMDRHDNVNGAILDARRSLTFARRRLRASPANVRFCEAVLKRLEEIKDTGC